VGWRGDGGESDDIVLPIPERWNEKQFHHGRTMSGGRRAEPFKWGRSQCEQGRPGTDGTGGSKRILAESGYPM